MRILMALATALYKKVFKALFTLCIYRTLLASPENVSHLGAVAESLVKARTSLPWICRFPLSFTTMNFSPVSPLTPSRPGVCIPLKEYGQVCCNNCI